MPPTVLPSLDALLTSAVDDYCTCLDEIGTETVGSLQAVARFHHLKIDPVSGEPMFARLADLLSAQLTEYCFSARRSVSAKTSYQQGKLRQEAKKLLRESANTGEAGELLIYFLIQAILRAPQLIAKMELKTNTRLESFGADGVHLRWMENESVLEIICGESKLEKTPSSAISNCVGSIEKFHTKKDFEHELSLATSHFKHIDSEFQAMVSNILANKEPGVRYRLKHACLVGYDWQGYANLVGNQLPILERELKNRYVKQKKRLHDLLETHFRKLSLPLVSFDIFLLPFRTVDEFRKAFDDAV